MHSVAAHFPEEPSSLDRAHAHDLFISLAALYPCHDCAPGFQRAVQEKPPNVSSREALVMWTCDLHNRVNAELGKPTVECDLKMLDKMWKESDEVECDE